VPPIPKVLFPEQHTQPFYATFSGTTQVSRCQKKFFWTFVVQREITEANIDHPAGRHSVWANQQPTAVISHFDAGCPSCRNPEQVEEGNWRVWLTRVRLERAVEMEVLMACRVAWKNWSPRTLCYVVIRTLTSPSCCGTGCSLLHSSLTRPPMTPSSFSSNILTDHYQREGADVRGLASREQCPFPREPGSNSNTNTDIAVCWPKLPHRYWNSRAIWDHTLLDLGRDDIPAFTPAEAGTRFSNPGGMQGWVDLVGWLRTVMVYLPKDGQLSQY